MLVVSLLITLHATLNCRRLHHKQNTHKFLSNLGTNWDPDYYY